MSVLKVLLSSSVGNSTSRSICCPVACLYLNTNYSSGKMPNSTVWLWILLPMTLAVIFLICAICLATSVFLVKCLSILLNNWSHLAFLNFDFRISSLTSSGMLCSIPRMF